MTGIQKYLTILKKYPDKSKRKINIIKKNQNNLKNINKLKNLRKNLNEKKKKNPQKFFLVILVLLARILVFYQSSPVHLISKSRGGYWTSGTLKGTKDGNPRV